MPTTDNTSVVGSALTANWADLNKGITGQVAEQTKLGLDQPLQAAIEAESQSYADQFAAARDNTTTAYLIRGYLDDADKLFPRIDADFNAASGVEATIKAFQLDRSDETLGALGAADSLEHQQYIGQQLQEKAGRERLLANAGGTTFLLEMLDPAELLAGWATFGGSKVLKLGRAGSAAFAAAGTTVPLALADQAGKDVSTFDYVLNAAMNAGVTAIWGGAANIPKPSLPGVQRPAGFTNAANDFLSETDKIANVNDLTRDLLRGFVDDPVRRGGLASNDNAVSFMRLYGNKADGLLYNWQQALDKDLATTTGLGFVGRKFDLTGKYGKARDELEDSIAAELARRDFEFNKTGSVTPTADARIGRLADQYEDMMGQMAELARDAGLPGFKDFSRRPGYFHRSWNENKMRAIEVEHGRDFTRDLLTRSVMSGLGLEKAEAGTIATAILTRMDAKQRGLRADFMGALGQADSDGIAVMLKDAGVDEGTIKSVMGRIDQNLSERGRIKYGKERLPLDMTLSAVAPNGKVVRMLDMIDTDLSRVGENYMQAMTGRSALARAGYGGDDASINDFKELQRLALEGRSEEYYRKLAEFKKNVKARFDNAGQPVQPQPTKDAPATVSRSDVVPDTFRTQADIQSRMKQLDYLLGDFTGIRPEDAILGPYAQRAKSFAQATMLAASGLWQVAETATIAWRFGAARTGAEFIKQFPGIAGVLRKIGRDPDLYDELGTVLGLDLARDVRVRPWLRQFEPNLAVQGDHTIDRVLHYGQQAVPILNGMKFVHQWQTRVSSNLAMNTLVRASNGDAAALKLVQEYGLKGADWDRVQAAVQANVRMNGKNARAMNWDAWAQADVESAMNAVTRMMDDSVLYGRAGQGSSFSRSGVGQVLGQFRSFVAFAHNKLLRGTIHNSGYTGLAMMLAHQYPLTVIMVAANEFRKGEDVSFDEAGLADLMQKAVGYTAGLGFIGDAAGIIGLSGGRGGISVPITGLANAGPAAAGAIGNALQGEGSAAAGDAVQAARAVLPFVSIMPGVAALQNALEE